MLALRFAFALVLVLMAASSYVRWGLCAKQHRKTWRICRLAQVGIVGLSTTVVAGAVMAGTP